ncbi:MAG: right-handed parallel beta-helix repeat-containing protein [Fibrobacterota bacterium]
MSGSGEHIQKALERAQPGDTVTIPSGTYRFRGGVSFPTGVFLRGAGRDKTVLNLTGEHRFGFILDGENGLKGRISGMTIRGIAPGKASGIKLVNSCRDFRIDHITFTRCHNEAVEVHGDARGVVDNCSFIDNWAYGVVVFGRGDLSWKNKLIFGTEEAVFVEDCYFEQRNINGFQRGHHIASNNGSRYVFRYNVIKDGDVRAQAVDAHGNKYYWPRGSRSFEIYGNNIQVGSRWVGMNIRGGDGLIFNNRFSGTYSVAHIHVMHECRKNEGSCSYPCIDQTRVLHIWNNTSGSVRARIHIRHPELIKERRDWFHSPPEDYTPFRYPHPLRKE